MKSLNLNFKVLFLVAGLLFSQNLFAGTAGHAHVPCPYASANTKEKQEIDRRVATVLAQSESAVEASSSEGIE